MDNKEKAKKIVTVITLNLILPTLDIFSDLGFIIELFTWDEYEYIQDEWDENNLNFLKRRYGIALSFFFLLNYLMCFLAWYRKEQEKLETFIFPLMNIYPQFCAGRVIKELWFNPMKGLKLKRNLDSDLSQLEVCLEAVPTVIILFIYGFVSQFKANNYPTIQQENSFDPVFWVTFTTSSLSGGLGLAKSLKLGVARIMGNGGPADGLLSGKFILTTIACLAGLVSKVANFVELGGRIWVWGDGIIFNKYVALMFLLNGFSFPVTIFTVIQVNNLKSWRIFIRQPHIILLPLFTFFSFQKLDLFNCKKDNTRVKISPAMTIFNCGLYGVIWIGAVVNYSEGTILRFQNILLSRTHT